MAAILDVLRLLKILTHTVAESVVIGVLARVLRFANRYRCWNPQLIADALRWCYFASSLSIGDQKRSLVISCPIGAAISVWVFRLHGPTKLYFLKIIRIPRVKLKTDYQQFMFLLTFHTVAQIFMYIGQLLMRYCPVSRKRLSISSGLCTFAATFLWTHPVCNNYIILLGVVRCSCVILTNIIVIPHNCNI